MQPTSIDVLEKQLGNDAYIVTSSEEIKDDDDENPLPSYRAKKKYKENLKTKSNFLNTDVDHTLNDISQPIVFAIDTDGLHKIDPNIKDRAKSLSEAMRCGKLGITTTGLLDSLGSKAIAASGGFYGDE